MDDRIAVRGQRKGTDMIPKGPVPGRTIFSHANKMTQAYHIMLAPLCKETGLPPMALDILLFLANDPEHNTAKDICRMRGHKSVSSPCMWKGWSTTAFLSGRRCRATGGRRGSSARKRHRISSHADGISSGSSDFA